MEKKLFIFCLVLKGVVFKTSSSTGEKLKLSVLYFSSNSSLVNEFLISLNPDTHEYTYFKEGKFIEYKTISKEIHFYKDIHTLLENAKEMETNHITDATQENLPVFLHN